MAVNATRKAGRPTFFHSCAVAKVITTEVPPIHGERSSPYGRAGNLANPLS
jgi:hypothetical protein